METDPEASRTQSRRRTRQTTNPLLSRLRLCYQSFLLHLMLGLSVTTMLLLTAIALEHALPDAVQILQAAASLPQVQPRQSGADWSQAVFSRAVYLRPGSADAYFLQSVHSSDTQNTASDPNGGERLYTTDGEKPLTVPILDAALPDADNLYQMTADTPAAHTAIQPADLSQSARYTIGNGGILFSNQTGYTVDAQTHLTAAYPIDAPVLPTMSALDTEPAAPLVLILHTHGTEAYAPDGAASVPANYTYRSEDTAQNVVSVGAVLAKTLEDAGISVLHCQTMFDAASYTDSYELSAAYIRKTLAAYPSIQYVFDVHRDALQDADGAMLRPITKIGAEVCAQVMSVVGTDAAGAYYPDWRDNLTVAVHLQKRLNDAYQAFARPINLRTATFNAQYAPGSLLLEIGAAGNSVEEARSAAYHLGVVLAGMILRP